MHRYHVTKMKNKLFIAPLNNWICTDYIRCVLQSPRPEEELEPSRFCGLAISLDSEKCVRPRTFQHTYFCRYLAQYLKKIFWILSSQGKKIRYATSPSWHIQWYFRSPIGNGLNPFLCRGGRARGSMWISMTW